MEVAMSQYGIHPDRESYDAARGYARVFSNMYVCGASTSPMREVDEFNRYLLANGRDQERTDAIVNDVACRIGLIHGLGFVAERNLSDELISVAMAKVNEKDGVVYAIHLSADPDVNMVSETASLRKEIGAGEIDPACFNWYFVLLTRPGLQYVATLTPAELSAVA